MPEVLFFGSAISLQASKPMIVARKPGKLPGELVENNYTLEYGENSLSIQKKAFFIKRAAQHIGLGNTKVLHTRISKRSILGPFDIITNRAVGTTKTTINNSQQLLKGSGFFLLFKGKEKTINQELEGLNRRYSIIENNLIINKERNY